MSAAATPAHHDDPSTYSAPPFSYAQAAKKKNVSSDMVQSNSFSQANPPGHTSTPSSLAEPTVQGVVGGGGNSDDGTVFEADAIVKHHEPALPQRLDDNSRENASFSENRVSESEALPVVPASSAVSAFSDTSAEKGKLNEATEGSSHGEMIQNEGQVSTGVEESTSQGRAEEGNDEVLPTGSKTPTTSAPALVEAPPPMVNYWEKRAQDAKNKFGATTKLEPFTNSQEVPTAKRYSHPSITSGNNNAKAGRRASIDRRGDTEVRPSRSRHSIGPSILPDTRRESVKQPQQQSAPLHPSQFPTLQDSSSWPTANLSAQDEGRRKATEKLDRQDEERQASGSSGKGHGKNEWLPMPFTPTVKFETPIPTGLRRGPRLAMRGGRDFNGSRGGFSTTINGTSSGSRTSTSTSAESTDAAPSRDRSAAGGANHRSPSSVRKAHSSNNDKPLNGEMRPEPSSIDRGRSQVVLPQETMESSISDVNVYPQSGAIDSGRPARDEAQYSQDKPNIAHVGSSNKAVDGRPHRRSSRTSEFDAGLDRKYGDRKRIGPITTTSVATQRSSGPFEHRRLENSTRPTESDAEQYQEYTSPPLRERGEGRSGRGRGQGVNRRNGSMLQGSYPQLNSQLNSNSHQYFHQPNTLNTAKSIQFQYLGASTFPRNGRRGTSAVGARSGAIPTDNARYPGPHQSSSQYPGTSTFGTSAFPPPIGYDLGAGPPASPLPINQFTNQILLMNGVATQLNYYFSLDNLCKDVFLRRHMDSQGFVALKLVADFARMRQLTTDFEMVKTVASQNPDFELHVNPDNNVYLRKRQGWQDFVLAMGEREPSAQHDGPSTGERLTAQSNMLPPLSAPNGYDHDIMHHHHPQQQSPTPSVAPFFTPFAPLSTASPVNVNGFPKPLPVNSYSASATDPQMSTISPPHVPDPSSETEINAKLDQDDEDDESDSFPDEKIDYQLTLFTRVSQSQSPNDHQLQGSPPNSKLQNASIDNEQHNTSDAAAKLEPSDRSTRLAELKERLTSPNLRHRSQESRSSSSTVYWIKNPGETSDLPANADGVPYLQICANAKQQRQNATLGHCPWDMKILYNFWSHFLLQNFNTKMYTDFRFFATEDMINGSRFGMDHLLEYYEQSIFRLDRPIRKRVARDFVNLAKTEDRQGDEPAFKRLRAAWRNGEVNVRSRKMLQEMMDVGLRQLLDN